MPRKKSAIKASASNNRGFDHKTLKWLRTSVWAFPLVLFIIVCILSVLRISGTSSGMYHNALYGMERNDPNLVANNPRLIRSDEWLSMTQVITSQEKNGFPRFNEDLGSGRDVSLQPEVPYIDWFMFFRPQNLSFFVMPLEYAFAFKWWFLAYSLIVSCYFFILRILPRKKPTSILISLAFGMSPFLFWWYQTAGFAPLAYGFLIVILFLRIINNEKIPLIKRKNITTALYVAALVFLLTSFALILYPPFQIPVVLGVGAFIIGTILNKKINGNLTFKSIARRLVPFFAGLIISVGLIGVFIVTRQNVLEAISNTAYPGARVISSGDLPMLGVFDSFLMPLLQSDFRGANYYTNQSEASNFILLLPFLLIPGFVILIREFAKERKLDWTLLAIQITGLLFLLRAFVPFGDTLYKLLLLHKVPNNRLLIGLGFVGIIQLVYIIKHISASNVSRKLLALLAGSYSLTCFVALLWTGSFATLKYPQMTQGMELVVILASVFSLIIFLYLANKPLLASVLLLGFTIASSYKILPLYQGLGFNASNALVQKIDEISEPNDTWATVDSPLFQNVSLLADRRTLTGVIIYPDVSYWDGLSDQSYDTIFNRQGHAFLTDDDKQAEPVKLIQNNTYQIKFSCDNNFLTSEIQFLLATEEIDTNCTKLRETVTYPKITVYMYEITDE